MRGTNRVALAAVVVLMGAGVALSGCSSDEPESTGITTDDSGEETTASTAAESSDSSAETTTTTAEIVNNAGAVEIVDYQYVNGDATVKVGESVTWTNDGENRHTVTAEADTFASSETIQPGQSYVQAFPTAGSFPYYCTFHPDKMSGTIIVTE